MTGEDEDEKLDPAVIAALYVEHGAELRNFLVGVLRDAHLASDALQLTFAKLMEQGHESRAESRKGWLFRVAYNQAMLIRRKQGVAERGLKKLAWRRAKEQEHSGPEEPVIRFEAVEQVREAMRNLSPVQLTVVRMRIYEDKTFAEIAAELKIPLGTALARMHAALKKLRESLGS